MACSSANITSAFDFSKQRAALEQLRREVEALDGLDGSQAVDEEQSSLDTPDSLWSAAPLAEPVQVLQSGSRTMSAASASTSKASAPSRAENRLQANMAELETKAGSLGSELQEAEEEVAKCSAVRSVAKAEWSRTLALASSAENREEKRMVSAQKLLEEVNLREAQHEAAYRLDRDKLRQRLRNLRMQARQAEKQLAEFRQDERFNTEFAQLGGEFDSDDGDCGKSTCSAGSIQPKKNRAFANITGNQASRSSSHTGIRRSGIHLVDYKKQLEASEEHVLQLRGRRCELQEAQKELEDREHELRKAARLSEKELIRFRKRSDLELEEGRLQEEATEMRAELQTAENEGESARKEAVRLRHAHERALGELSDHDLQFQEHEQQEANALRKIDDFLSNGPPVANEERQAHVAEWLEADISARQVGHMKRRLSEMVADASARAQVLEQAVAELHCDLDRRAAIILELVERQSATVGACPTSANPTNTSTGGEQDTGATGSVSTPSSSLTASPVGQRGVNNASGDGHMLEWQALEAELQHQRGLFDLRSKQVVGLEQRLQELLAHEAPRVHALRTWIAVHEPLSQERLEACLAQAATDQALRADVEAMREDRSAQLEAARSEWRAARQHITEAGSDAKCGADEASLRAATMQRRRDSLARNLEKTMKSQRGLAARLQAAGDAVERDHRRLVDITARQLRARSATPRAGEPMSRPCRLREGPGQAARQALESAREIVEAARSQQVETLAKLRHEVEAVQTELERVGGCLETAMHHEEKSKQELAEQESRAETASNTAPQTNNAIKATHCQSPRQRPPSKRLITAERRYTRCESDLESVEDQLRKLDKNFEEVEAGRQEAGQQAHSEVSVMREALESERARQRASSTGILKRYRAAQLAATEAEHRCNDVRTRYEAVSREIEEANSALQTARKHRRAVSRERENAMRACAVGQSTEGLGHGNRGLRHGSSNSQDRNAAFESDSARATSSSAAEGPVSPPLRSLPSISEVRQRAENNQEAYAFYLHAFPLLQGTPIGVFRRVVQRFEPRQLLLSLDLQRLELWPAQGDGGSSAASRKPSALNRRRIAEAFLRVESLVRVHVPRTTLLAVQQTIISAAATRESNQLEGDVGGGLVCQDGGLVCGDAEAPHPGAAVRPQRVQALPFDLVIAGGEPWRLSTSDVNTFHIVTAALAALQNSRTSLAAYAATLSLGSLQSAGAL